MDGLVEVIGENEVAMDLADVKDLDTYNGEIFAPILAKYPPISSVDSVMDEQYMKGCAGRTEITIFNDKVEDGDAIWINGNEFVAREKPSDICQENEFSIADKNKITSELIGKILTSEKSGIYQYLYDLYDASIIIHEIGPSSSATNIISSGYGIECDIGQGIASWIDLNDLTEVGQYFIGRVDAEFSSYGKAKEIKDRFSDKFYQVFHLKMRVAVDCHKEFEFYQVVEKEPFQDKVVMRIANSKDYITLSPGFECYKLEAIKCGEVFEVIGRIQTLFNKTLFHQTIYLQLNPKVNYIINDDGETIASTKGAAASLKYSNAKEKIIQSFEISSQQEYEILFKAKISGVNFKRTSSAESLCPGYRVEMEATNGDVLSINLGYGGLTCLQDPRYISQASSAYGRMFLA